ncbi:MAG: hypothetical protein KDA63_13015, partial [Planctomycetales bacterium]|nr:hypothetical protein [Planctomycetales bacterium]
FAERLERRWNGYANVPLDVKARFFEWQLSRYHLSDHNQAFNRVRLAEAPHQRPVMLPGSDTSTWNGALLAALSYEYAVTGDRDVLDRIARLLQGMHLFFEVTGQPGLMARCVVRSDGEALDEMRANRYRAADGHEYLYLGDPAKGTLNQIAIGYAVMMMHAYDDLPSQMQQLARNDMHAMVVHLINHEYRLTNRDGNASPYGDVTPVVASVGVPFNAQVAYLVVAVGYSFPSDQENVERRIREQFVRLRGEHHIYYQEPLRGIVLPQRIGGSPFLKGMNDRNHVTNAAFTGLSLELDHARRNHVEPNGKFLYRLGRTMYWSMRALDGQRNALCNFMWAGILSDQQVFEAIAKREQQEVAQQVSRNLVDGVEQLRRFRLDRFIYDGHDVKTNQLQWNDRMRPDDYYWKADPRYVRATTGPRENTVFCAIDYLAAYWLMRYYQLDTQPVVARPYANILARTADLR